MLIFYIKCTLWFTIYSENCKLIKNKYKLMNNTYGSNKMFIVSTATFYSKIVAISHGHPAFYNIQYPAPVHYSFNFPHPACTNQVEEIFNHRFIIVMRFFLSFFLFFRIKNNGWMTTACDDLLV